MRYRKSIKICKGVRLNLSKSGVSATIGVRGLSVNTGPRGTYLNTGIPGTGIYDRRKIGGGSSGASNAASRDAAKTERKEPSMERRLGAARQVVAKNEAAEQMIQVLRYAEVVPSENQIRNELCTLKPEKYVKNVFSTPKPSEAEFVARLEREAEANVATFAFWRTKKLREQYVEERLPKQYASAVASWQAENDAFEQEESSRAASMDAIYQQQYESAKACLEQKLSGDADYVESALDSWLETIELPLDFSIQYEYESDSHSLYIDLDLPEIEDIPDEIAFMSASGTMKVKKKTQQKLREDYARCIFGFAVFVASHCFGVSVLIENVTVSGYTQRRNKIGDLVDDYVYSVEFERGPFEGKDLSNVDPVEFCTKGFKNRCNITKTFVLRAIEPFDAAT